MITRDCIEKIRESVDIYDVVSQYVVMKKCGCNWRGLSPFNQERTPSFFVMPAKKVFRCFSSGNAGDVFRFIQLIENVSFGDAVEMIASKFGIPLEFERQQFDKNQQCSKKNLYDVLDFACRFFEKNFWEDTSAAKKLRNYWSVERKFSLDVAKKNGIGFAGNDSRVLIKNLVDAGFQFDAIKGSGIFFYKDGERNQYNGVMRFLSRLTIPIMDIQGRVVGFSARVVDGITPAGEMSDAKYINSPETDIFHKGNILFGMDRARQHIGDDDGVWLVEGQFDVFRCWENGICSAVAPQGTAVTDAQLNIIRRYSRRINCMLDGDAAGMKAAERVLPLAIKNGIDVFFYILPAGEDPDSFFQEQFEKKFCDIKNHGVSGIVFLVNRLLKSKNNMSAQERAEELTKIYEVIAESASSVARKWYLDELSCSAGLDRHSLSQDFNLFMSKRKFTSAPPVIEKSDNTSDVKVDSADIQLLSVVLADSRVADKVAGFVDCQFMQQLTSDSGKLLIKILNEVREGMWNGISSINNVGLFSDCEKNMACSLVADFDDNCGDNVATANMCLKKMHCDFVKGELEKINEEFQKISLDDIAVVGKLQQGRMRLRGMLRCPPQISVNCDDRTESE